VQEFKLVALAEAEAVAEVILAVLAQAVLQVLLAKVTLAEMAPQIKFLI
jgi:hypothetical protein